MKKLVSSLLVVILTFVLVVPVFAETGVTSTVTINGETITTETIRDDEQFRTVRTTDSTGTYISEFNKQTNEVTLNKDGELQLSQVVTPQDPYTPESSTSKEGPSYVTGPTDSGAYTQKGSDQWFGLYYKTTFYENETVGWNISLSDEAYPYYKETSDNRDDFESFKDKVNEAAEAESKVYLLGGAAYVSTWVGLLTAAPATLGTTALIALLLAIGGGLTAATEAVHAYFANKDAEDIYYRIKLSN